MMTSASQKIVQTSFACFATLSFIIISGKKKRVAEHNGAWHTNDIWHHIDMYSTLIQISADIYTFLSYRLPIPHWTWHLSRGAVAGRRRKIFFYCSRFESRGSDLRLRDFETTKKNNLIRRKNRVYFSMTCVPIPKTNFLLGCSTAES